MPVTSECGFRPALVYPSKLERVPGIDVLRGIAIALVLIRHTGLVPIASRVGWIGVDLFFVLSGYLVSGLLFAEWRATGAMNVRRFLLRRGLKIWPQFYAMVVATILVFACLHERVPGKHLLAEIMFLQNYYPGVWSHTWSLAVEEHFYLGLALSALLMRNRIASLLNFLPHFFVAAMTTVLALRILTMRFAPETTELAHIWPTHLRADALLAGVLLAYLRQFHRDRLARWVQKYASAASPVSVLCLAPAYFLGPLNPWMYTIGLSLNAVAFGLLLLLVLHSPHSGKAPGLSERLLSRLGRISYGTYLWQGPVLLFVDRTCHTSAIMSGTASAVLLPIIGLLGCLLIG